MRPGWTVDKSARELMSLALEKDSMALGRISRMLDDREDGYEDLQREIYPLGGRAHVVGITGPPGAGKSTLVNCVITSLREVGETVAVLAVDPTSPYSGGAVLGDRVRMQGHATDPGVFIRSLATRGHVGGLSGSVRSITALLDAAGFEIIILETVGVGQEEVEVRGQAHTTIYMTVPGLGDGIQAMKAGVLEIADIYLVNKADLSGADVTVRDLTSMLAMSETGTQWTPPVLTAVASQAQGIEGLLREVDRHHKFMTETDAMDKWRLWAADQSIREAIRDAVGVSVSDLVQKWDEKMTEDIENVSARKQDPGSVAKKWLDKV